MKELNADDYTIIFQCLCNSMVKGEYVEKFAELKEKVSLNLKELTSNKG